MKRFLTLIPIALLLAACGGDGSSTPAKPLTEASPSEGELLFQSNCKSCHLVNRELVGPPLSGASANWKNRSDLYDYIHNPADYIENRNDERIKGLHKKYGMTMPSFPSLTNAQIDSIFHYIDTEGGGKP